MIILIIFLSSSLFILGTIALYVVPYLMDFYIKISKLFLFIPIVILLAIGVLIYQYNFKYKEINYNQEKYDKKNTFYYKKNSLGESKIGTRINQSRYNNWNSPSSYNNWNSLPKIFQNNNNEGSFISVGSNTELSNNGLLLGRSPPNNFFILYTIFIILSIIFCIILSIIIATSNKIIITNKKHEEFQVDYNCNICKEYYAKPYNTY